MRPLSVLFGIWLGVALTATAAPIPETHAITDVRIVQAPGQVVESGTVVVRDGLIVAVGAGIEPPADAQVWEGEGLTLYPGLIDAYVPLSWPGPEPAEDAPASTGHTNALVHPERAMADWSVDSQKAERLRGAGFTTAVIAPEEGLFRGSSTLVNLAATPSGASILDPRVAQNVTVQSNPGFGGDYPGSLMGAVALFRQTLYDTRWYVESHDAYQANPRQARPAYSTTFAELAAVAAGEETVVLETGDMLGTLRIAGLVSVFGLVAGVVGNGDENKRLDTIAATGFAHILPVAFPEAPEVGEEDDLTVDLATLRHWDRAPDNPKALLDAGLTVAFTSHMTTDPSNVHEHLATAIERGLSADRALAAFTTTPAEMLGVADRIGTIETGKIANLVLVEGDLFVADTKILAIWVDGVRSEVKESKPPEVEPAGTWELIVDAGPQGQLPITIVLEGDATDLSGSLVGLGGSVPLSSAAVSGDRVEITFNGAGFGMPGMFTMSFTVEGDSVKGGTGQAPQGEFTFTGRRTEKPATPEAVR
ncbi:MAG: amidohydrolase family protein [Acidobacteriota bacterium]